jgi:hypothetical protein
VGAEVALATGGEVLGNIAAMESAVALAAGADPFGVDDLLAVHRTLMDRSPTPGLGGQVRTGQNWIGGRAHDPCGAAFVPLPPELVPALLDDLLARLGRVRANSGIDLLLRVLPGAPVISVESASALIGRSKARTTDAVNALAAAGILRQRSVGRRRYRVFEATGVLDLFTGLERGLATPAR